MTYNDYKKLFDMKNVWKVPLAVASLTDDSTSEEIAAALGGSNEKLGLLVYHAAALQVEYETTLAPKTYIGNHECLFSGSVAMDDSGEQVESATLDFTYASGGKLRTISITVQVSDFECSCKVYEQGGANEYYLPVEVYNLTESTGEAVFEAFGGSEGVKSLCKAVSAGASVYIKTSTASVPVSCDNLASILLWGSFQKNSLSKNTLNTFSLATTAPGNAKMNVLDINKSRDYILPASLVSLGSSSQSADISEVFGGADGFKAMGQAVKDGRAVRISGKVGAIDMHIPCSVRYDDSSSTEVGAYITFLEADRLSCFLVVCNNSTGAFTLNKVS